MPEKVIPLDKLLDQVGNLPPMPRVVEKALQIIQDPNSSMKDLANVIKLDQAMTSLILRWVNSGYYSLRSNLVTIEQAVTYLGQRTVHPVANAADNANRLIAALAGRQIGQQRAQGRGDIRAARGLEADMGKLYANGRIFQRARLFRHGLVRPDGNFRTRPFDGKHGRGNDIARGLST